MLFKGVIMSDCLANSRRCPEALKTLPQHQIERIKREDDEEQWISGEELCTEGSSEEDSHTPQHTKRHGEKGKRNVKKFDKVKHTTYPDSPASISCSDSSTGVTPVSPPTNFSFNIPDVSVVESKKPEELSLQQDAGTSDSTPANKEEEEEEPAEISWRPKRGSIKLPNLPPEGSLVQ